MVTPQRWIDFTVLVKIGRNGPGAMVEIEEKDHTFADVDEEADLTTASMIAISNVRV